MNRRETRILFIAVFIVKKLVIGFKFMKIKLPVNFNYMSFGFFANRVNHSIELFIPSRYFWLLRYLSILLHMFYPSLITQSSKQTHNLGSLYTFDAVVIQPQLTKKSYTCCFRSTSIVIFRPASSRAIIPFLFHNF